MWTPWHFSRQLRQLTTDQISYTDSVGPLDTPKDITSVGSVRGNAAAHGGLITVEANSLVFRDYGFVLGADIVVGIEIQLSVTRLSRIQDRLIQLYTGSEAVGANLADDTAGDVQVYGGVLARWQVDGIVLDYTSPQFGCVIDLGPHQRYPSNNTITIHSVAMRLDLVSLV
jgi:hypothetical protein